MNASTGALIGIGVLGLLALVLSDTPKIKEQKAEHPKNKKKEEPKKVIL